MDKIKALLKKLAIVFLGLLGLTCALVSFLTITILFFPQVLVQPRVIAQLPKVLAWGLGSERVLRWGLLHLEIAPAGALWEKELRVTGVALEFVSEGVRLRVPRLSARVVFTVNPRERFLQRIPLLRVEGAELQVVKQDQGGGEHAAKGDQGFATVAKIGAYPWEEVSLDFSQIAVGALTGRGRLEFHANRLKIFAEEARGEVQAQGVFGKRSMTALVSAKLRGGIPQLAGGEVEACRLRALWGKAPEKDAVLNVWCRGHVLRKPLKGETRLAEVLPRRIPFAGEGKLRGLSAKAAHFRAALHVPRVGTGVLSASADAELAGTPQDFRLRYEATTQLPNFRQLVHRLSGSRFAIPAPLNQLSGTASCSLSGTYHNQRVNPELGKVPLACSVDLEGPGEGIKLAAAGALTLGRPEAMSSRAEPPLRSSMVVKSRDLPRSDSSFFATLNLDIAVSRLDFTLPKVGLSGNFPRLVPDKRIEGAASPKKEPSRKLAFAYQVAIHTLPDKPIRIYSDFTGEPVPISANLRLESGKPVLGDLEIKNTDLDLLRRKMLIEQLRLTLQDGTESQVLKGKVEFKADIYKIWVSIYGTPRRPQFVLESEPVLGEQEIVALLLYGKLPSGLETEELRSVNATRSAMASQAISMLSMYFLAATPVESISFDPRDNMFSANVKLREGLSLTVGTNADTKGELGLRKRLSRRMSFETSIVRDESRDVSKGIAMLKWGLRY